MRILKVKIITGFRKDQQYTIDSEEAHKAYWLFLNPEKRGIFDNGVALLGSHIQGIEPDYNATMGWNESHVLNGDDWNQINSEGIALDMKKMLKESKDIVKLHNANPDVFLKPRSEIKLLR